MQNLICGIFVATDVQLTVHVGDFPSIPSRKPFLNF